MSSRTSVDRVKPVFKWAGGKRQLLPTLISHVPVRFERYYEPFLGGGALFFELVATGRIATRGGAVLGDANILLIDAYAQIAARVDDVIHALGKYQHDKATYYAVRAAFPQGDFVTRAAQLIYLNRTCFNGLWRVNRKGRFNVPFGDYANPTICDPVSLRQASAALWFASLVAGDFEVTLKTIKRGDFVYFDPPYWPASATSNFTAYTKAPFGPADQERLRDVALDLKRKGVHVLLSNADVPPVRALYARGFNVEVVSARRVISSKAGSRGAVGELLIT